MTATCPRCGLTVECDDRRDAELWLLHHWDASHTPQRTTSAGGSWTEIP